MSRLKTTRPELVTAPVSLPIALEQVKPHLFIAVDDTSHDTELVSIIEAATEQFESDTDQCLMQRTLRVYFETFGDDEIYLPSRPVASIASVKYYDDTDILQTLATSVYDLDASSRAVRLKWDQVWPSTATRWDAAQVNYVCGSADEDAVPALAKRALLLLCGYYFAANRGDNDKAGDMRAYDALVTRNYRSTYP